MAEVLSAQQIADRLGVAEKTVRRWIGRGDLPAERDGHAFAIDLDDALAVFAKTPAGRAAARVSASTSDRDEELMALRDEVAELRGRHREAREQLHWFREQLEVEQRARVRLELELEERSIRAA